LNFDEKALRTQVADRICVTVSFPIDNMILQKIISLAKNNESIYFVFFIEDEKQYGFVESLNLGHSTIIPVFNQTNLHFFEESIFTSERDLMEQRLSMREIFRNQKLNLNYFGVLTVYADGTVKTTFNSEMLGNIYSDKLIEIIYHY
jgi:pseudo-rSAM protein